MINHITSIHKFVLSFFRRKTIHMTSSVVISQDRHLITSSHEVWWEFSKGTSSQVLYISDKSVKLYMLPSDYNCNQFFFFVSI